ncbi:MAG: glycoside hydrolase domain-containing protein [Armatimonadota bacterium]
MMTQYYRDNFDRIPVGVPPHSIGEWDHLVNGNHRAVVRVEEAAPAVCAYLPWRRRDRYPESKHVRVVAAATGAIVENSMVVTSNREYGEVVFEPVTGPGDYYLYYLVPMDDDHAHDWPRWAFPVTRYLPSCHTASPAWLEVNGVGRDALRTLPQTQINFDANIPPEGDFGTAKMDGKVYAAAWRALPEAALVEFQSRTAWDTFFPMEIVATQDEHIAVEHRGRYRPFLLFPESRRNPIRMTDVLPHHWAVRSMEELDRFADTVCRNEYFVFQIGVYAHKGTTPDLRVAWSDLAGPDGAAIPAAALTCFNTGGVDQHGRPFTKTVHVETRKVQALWFGVDVPRDAVPGIYSGEVTVRSGDTPAQTVHITLEVTPAMLADRGDGDHWRMSRLRWLNSRLGLDDDVCPPYTPVAVDGLTIGVLGRTVKLGANGLPARLTSHIDMFEIVPAGREILAAPIEMRIEADGGSLPAFTDCDLVSAAPAHAVYRAAASDDRLSAVHETTVEAEGVVVSAITLTAREAATVTNAQLTLSLPADVARLILWPTDNADGGACPDAWEAEAWQLARLWVGDYNAGLALRVPPGDNAWDNAHRGRLRLRKDAERCTLTLDSGPVILPAGESITFTLEFYLTPFRPLPRDHWQWRYYHAEYHTELDVPLGVAAGATVFIQHHETPFNPYINYPLLTAERLEAMAQRVHDAGGLFKFYYTVRELSVRCPELWALRSLGDEILVPPIGHFGFDDLDDLPLEYQLRDPYNHPFTGMPWLCEHLVTEYHTRWHSLEQAPELADGSLQVNGASRWGNFYIESLRWLMENAGLDGLYFDGLTFDRTSLRRVRKTLLRGKPFGLVDNHGGPSYIDRAPFYDSLWFGEGADYSRGPDYWITTVSGIPFGLPGELLMPEAGVARGMIYGVSQRFGWMPREMVNPSALWRWWDGFDIAGARMLGYWHPDCPVRVNHPDVRATAYVHHGKRLAIALASWAQETVSVAVNVNWHAVGLAPDAVMAAIPAIDFFQSGQPSVSLNTITIEPGKGWIIEVH